MVGFNIREIARTLLNYTGGTLRWVYGSVWRTLFKKPKYTYKEVIEQCSRAHLGTTQTINNNPLDF